MIEQRNILVTGGSGLLGSELRKILPDAMVPTHEGFDITDFRKMNDYVNGRDVRLLVHAAAFTSPPRINENPLNAVNVNIIGTSNIVRLCAHLDIKLIYVSTDYVFQGNSGMYKESDPLLPINKYAWSKLGGECAVRLYDNSIIVRTSFSENEFPYDKAFIDQWTSRLPVREFANRLVSLFNRNFTGVIHIGGPRITVFQYARTISPEKNIGELKLDEVSFSAPKDTSLDSSLYQKTFNM